MFLKTILNQSYITFIYENEKKRWENFRYSSPPSDLMGGTFYPLWQSQAPPRRPAPPLCPPGGPTPRSGLRPQPGRCGRQLSAGTCKGSCCLGGPASPASCPMEGASVCSRGPWLEGWWSWQNVSLRSSCSRDGMRPGAPSRSPGWVCTDGLMLWRLNLFSPSGGHLAPKWLQGREEPGEVGAPLLLLS